MNARRRTAPGVIVLTVLVALPVCVLWAALAALRNGASPALHPA